MKREKIITSFLILFAITRLVNGQPVRSSIALPYTQLSTYSIQQADVFAFTGNQAALVAVKQPGAAIYGERRFMLAEINAYAAAIVVPTSKGNFGLSIRYVGFKNFNENTIGVAYARSLGKKIDFGAQFNYYGYRIPVYGNASTINFEAAILLHCTDRLHAGIQVYNPVGGKLGKTGDQKLPAIYKAGMGYDASEQFFIAAEIIKEEDKAINVMSGLQYHFAKRFFARAGFLSASSIAFAGAGTSWKNIRLDVSASYHQQLGISPGILIMTNFGKNKSQ